MDIKDLQEQMKETKIRHNLTKELVSMLGQMDMGQANPFRLLDLQMEIMDKISSITRLNEIDENMTEKEILKIEKSLLKILDVVNREAE